MTRLLIILPHIHVEQDYMRINMPASTYRIPVAYNIRSTIKRSITLRKGVKKLSPSSIAYPSLIDQQASSEIPDISKKNQHCLRREHRLRLLLDLSFSSSNWVGLGSAREVLSLDGWLRGLGGGWSGQLGGRRSRATVVNIRCGLVTVVSKTLRHQTLSMRGVVTSLLLQLVCLVVENLLSVLDMSVNKLAVGNVDKREQVNNTRCDQRQSPQREELDEEIGDEGSDECL